MQFYASGIVDAWFVEDSIMEAKAELFTVYDKFGNVLKYVTLAELLTITRS
jgi:hypothetical protein